MKTFSTFLRFKRPMMIFFAALSLLAACKKDKNDSNVTPVTLYGLKVTEGTQFDSYQLISFDPSTLAESVIFNLNEIVDGFRIVSPVYLPTTNEIIGLDRSGMVLIKINVATKQKTILELSKDYSTSFEQLVLDNSNNLYSLRGDGRQTYTNYTLVKLDPATGGVTALKPCPYGYSLTYLPKSNEIVGMNYAYTLAKYNLTTGDTVTHQLGDSKIDYSSLWKDNKSNLYAIKNNYNTNVSTIVKIDPVTYTETVVTTLSSYDALEDLIYIPQSNEFVGAWNDQSLFRYNLGTNQPSVTALTTDPKISYGFFTTN